MLDPEIFSNVGKFLILGQFRQHLPNSESGSFEYRNATTNRVVNCDERLKRVNSLSKSESVPIFGNWPLFRVSDSSEP